MVSGNTEASATYNQLQISWTPPKKVEFFIMLPPPPLHQSCWHVITRHFMGAFQQYVI